MSEDNPMTVGDVRKAIKDLPDDMPIAIQTDGDPEYLECVSTSKEMLNHNPEYSDGYELDDEVETFCFNIM